MPTTIRSSSRTAPLAHCLAVGLCLCAVGCAGAGGSGEPPTPYAQAVGSLRDAVIGALAQRQTPRVAIMPVEAEGEVARQVGGLVGDELASQLAANPNITLVERAKLDAIIQEMSLQQSGLVREEDQIQMGKLAGAQVMVAIRATHVGEQTSLSVRVLDVATSTALTGANLRVAYDDALQAAIADMEARRNIRTSKEVLAALGQVRAGDLSEAHDFFEPLSKESGERRSVGLMGLAAVAFARGQLGPAKELCEVSRQESTNPTHCWVVEGGIAFAGGDADRARDLYTRAMVDEGTLMDWQRSAAANGLGLIAVATDDIDMALAHYDKAIALDPSNTEALSNKARILQDRGDLQTAITLYQRGMKADPDDKVLALLLRDAEVRAQLAQDQQRQNSLAQMARSIVEGSKTRAAAARKRAPGDGWTSQPLTLTVMPWQDKGAPASRLGETSFLQESVRAGVEGVAGVRIVDRQLLGQVLEELQIGNSALGEQSTALQVGRILSAKMLLGGTVVRMDGQWQVTLKLIDTESTRILGSVNEIFESDDRLSGIANTLRDKLAEKMSAMYPLRGKVVSSKGKRAKINVGSNVGVRKGMRFRFSDAKGGTDLGTGEVVEAAETSAWVEMHEGKAPKAGARGQREEKG